MFCANWHKGGKKIMPKYDEKTLKSLQRRITIMRTSSDLARSQMIDFDIWDDKTEECYVNYNEAWQIIQDLIDEMLHTVYEENRNMETS